MKAPKENLPVTLAWIFDDEDHSITEQREIIIIAAVMVALATLFPYAGLDATKHPQ